MSDKYFLIKSNRTSSSGHNTTRRHLHQSSLRLSEVNSAPALYSLDKPEEVSQERVRVWLFKCLALDIHAITQHAEVGLDVGAVVLQQTLVDIGELLSHGLAFDDGVVAGLQSSLCSCLVLGRLFENVFFKCNSSSCLQSRFSTIARQCAFVLKFEFFKFCRSEVSVTRFGNLFGLADDL